MILAGRWQQRRAAPSTVCGEASLLAAAYGPGSPGLRRFAPGGPACTHERAPTCAGACRLRSLARWSVEPPGRLAWQKRSGSHVLSNFHLGTSLGPLFCIFEQLGGYQLAYVCFSTIRANLSRHAFHHHCQATALKSNCCCAGLSRSFFADNAFHEILFLQSRSHSEGSGS